MDSTQAKPKRPMYGKFWLTANSYKVNSAVHNGRARRLVEKPTVIVQMGAEQRSLSSVFPRNYSWCYIWKKTE